MNVRTNTGDFKINRLRKNRPHKTEKFWTLHVMLSQQNKFNNITLKDFSDSISISNRKYRCKRTTHR